MFSYNQRGYTFLIYFIIPLSIVLLGSWIAYIRHFFAFGFGDHGLFFTFAKSILYGETMFKDFIHFRAPGIYYFYAFMLYLFGEKFSILSLTLLLESYVLQTVAAYYFSLALTKAIWGRPIVTFALCGVIALLITPSIYQLRTALPLFVFLFYALSFPREGNRINYLFIVGIGISQVFFFGQEIAILLGWTILNTEICISAIQRQFPWSPLLLLAAGFLVLTLPIVAYFFTTANGLDFLYYTTYYAFFVQPSGMNLPYPSLSIDTIIFYAPFIGYTLAVAIFIANNRFNNPLLAAFTCYAIMRLVSALGRSEILHLFFSLSDLFILGPVIVYEILRVNNNLRRLKLALKASIFLIFVFILALWSDISMVLLSAPLLLLACYQLAQAKHVGEHP